jgi:glycosyltransferase involved in cell wall biosynthesis
VVDEALFLPTRLGLARRLRAALRDHRVDVLHSFSAGAAALVPHDVAVAVQAWWHPARATVGDRFAWAGSYGAASVAERTPAALAPVAGRLAGVVRVLQVHASDALCYRRADAICCATETAMSFFRARGWHAERVEPALSVLDRPPAREPADVLRVTCCAHPLDRPWKGVRHLLAALPRVRSRDIALTLVGGGSERLAAEIEAGRAAGVSIEALGHVPREAYLEHLERRTDVLVAPALWEEWGYVLFEALARGVPAIAFDLYPYSETIDADLGVLVRPGDHAALAAAIDAAADGRLPDPARVLAAAAALFGPAAVAARALPVYTSILSRSRP